MTAPEPGVPTGDNPEPRRMSGYPCPDCGETWEDCRHAKPEPVPAVHSEPRCTGDDSCTIPSHWPDPAYSGPHRGTAADPGVPTGDNAAADLDVGPHAPTSLAVHPEGTGDDLRDAIHAARFTWVGGTDGGFDGHLTRAVEAHVTRALAAERAAREAAEARVGPCDCYPGGFTPDTYEGPQETCPVHGRPYVEWVARAEAAEQRLAAVLTIHRSVNDVRRGRPMCIRCDSPYPCHTAEAAGPTPEAQQ